MAMPRKGVTPRALEALSKRREVAALYLAGLTQWEIAGKVGITQGNVSRHLRAVRAEWAAAARADFEARLAEELARINAIERRAWECFERSCRDAESRHVRTETGGELGTDGKPTPTKTISEKTTKGQVGDPRFLERVSWCVEQRLKVLGGYAPTKVAPTTPDGTAPYDPGSGDETERLRVRLIALFDTPDFRAHAVAFEAAAGQVGANPAGTVTSPDPDRRQNG
jgi:DNA-binding CsgD family transcriptional regulator